MIQFELSGLTIFSTGVGATYQIHGLETQSTYLFGAADTSATLTYSIRPNPNAADPFPIADVFAPLLVSELNGENLLTGAGADAGIYDLNWVDQTGASQSTTVLYFFKSSSSATGFEGLQQESFFYLAGAELDFASTAEVQSFSESITSITAGSGVYGPDQAISIFELFADNPFVAPIGTESEDRLVGNRFDNEIQGLSGNDTIFGGGGEDELGGGFGNDVLRGEAGSDLLRGGDGKDVILGGNGRDTINGGAGNDELIGGAGHDQIFGGGGADWILGGAGSDDVSGGNRNDTINGAGGNDYLNGGKGNDLLAGGAGRDFIVGGSGRDVLRGGAGGDTLDGGAGRDVLNGGAGFDRLSGAGGEDTFVFSVGTARVLDFSELDLVRLTPAVGIDSFADLAANHMSQANGHVFIDDDDGNRMVLENTSFSDLSEEQFLF